MVKQNLTLIRGDSKTYSLHFRNSNGTDLNITGWTIYLTVKRNYTDADIDAILQKIVITHTDPTHGQTSIVLENSDTENLPIGVFLFDIQAKTNATPAKIYTIMRGQYIILEDVTRTH